MDRTQGIMLNRRTVTAKAARRSTSAGNGRARFTDHYLPYLLAQASAIACAEFQEPLRASGLSNLAWRMLATLADEGRLTVGQLSRIVLAQQPRVTQVIAQLEVAGLVARRSSSADRRKTFVTITERGHRRIKALLGTARRRERSAAMALSLYELKALKDLLRKIVLPAFARGTAGSASD